MKKFFSWTLALGLLTAAALPGAAQSVGVGTTTPNASAALDVQSTTQGLLVPRLTASQRTAITNAATGLLVYQTDAPAGFYFYNGTAWTTLTGPAGPGVPTGGTAGQVLSKVDGTDYNTQWTTSATGGANVQLHATSTNAQTRPIYGFGRYTFNFNNVVSGNSSAWTGNNTFTVPTGQGGFYAINTNVLLTAYTLNAVPAIVPEVEITRGGTTTIYYGTGTGSPLFQGSTTDNTAGPGTGPTGAPFSWGRGNATFFLPLQAGDVLKVYYRFSAQSTSASQTVSFSTDGSSFLSLVKLN